VVRRRGKNKPARFGSESISVLALSLLDPAPKRQVGAPHQPAGYLLGESENMRDGEQ